MGPKPLKHLNLFPFECIKFKNNKNKKISDVAIK